MTGPQIDGARLRAGLTEMAVIAATPRGGVCHAGSAGYFCRDRASGAGHDAIHMPTLWPTWHPGDDLRALRKRHRP